MTQVTSKYRPSLTGEQILHILTLVKRDYCVTEPVDTTLSFKVIQTLAPFQAKIESAAIAPAYTTQEPKPKVNSLEALGGEVDTIILSASDTMVASDNKEQYWSSCYALYLLHPEKCTIAELQAAKEHMYINDLMTPEQEKDYEQQS